DLAMDIRRHEVLAQEIVCHLELPRCPKAGLQAPWFAKLAANPHPRAPTVPQRGRGGMRDPPPPVGGVIRRPRGIAYNNLAAAVSGSRTGSKCMTQNKEPWGKLVQVEFDEGIAWV